MKRPSIAVRNELRRLVRERFGSYWAGIAISNMTMDELRYSLEPDYDAGVTFPDEMYDPHQPGVQRRRYDIWVTDDTADALDALVEAANRDARHRAACEAFR